MRSVHRTVLLRSSWATVNIDRAGNKIKAEYEEQAGR